MPDPSVGPELLIAPALLALAALGVHAWKVKGPRVAVAFFAASFVFGVLRGNFIGWFMQDAARQLGTGGDGGLMPYVMRAPLLRIGYASLFECCGWMLALYLAWTVSEQILRRLPSVERRLFPLLLLASVFTAALGYAVEAGANAMHWWTWTLPLQSKLLIELPAAGLWAWFSVAPDFLLPFLLLLARPRPGLHWLTLLLFPLHMASNLLDLVAGRQAWTGLGEPSWLMHLAMLVAFVLLAALDRRELPPTAMARKPGGRTWTWVPVTATAFVLAVLWAGLGPISGRWDLWAATSPLLVLVLLAIPRLPLWSVALVALACAPLAAGRGLAAAVPLVTLGFFRATAPRMTAAGPRRLLVIAAAGVLGLTLLWQAALARAEEAYVRARLLGADWPRTLDRLERLSPSSTGLHLAAGHAFAAAGSHELAVDAYREALRREPDLAPAHNGLGLSLLKLDRATEAVTALEQATGLVPRAGGLHQNLGLALLVAGRLEAAQAAFEQAHALDPADPRPTLGLARVAVARGRADDGLRILTAGLGLVRNDGEIHLALGVLHQDAGRTDLAEQHFARAIALAAGPALANAYSRLALLLVDRPERLADARRAAESAVGVERSAITLDTLGWVLLRQGESAAAQAVLLEALDASPEGAVRRRIQQHLAAASGR